MPRVLLCDKLEGQGLEILKAGGLEIDNRPGLKGAELQEALRNADGAVVRSGTKITAAELETPGRLRAIVRAGVGVDNIDVAAATRKKVIVMNTPSGNTVSAAEQTIALLGKSPPPMRRSAPASGSAPSSSACSSPVRPSASSASAASAAKSPCAARAFR